MDDIPGGLVIQSKFPNIINFSGCVPQLSYTHLGHRKRTHWFISDERDNIARTAFDMGESLLSAFLF